MYKTNYSWFERICVFILKLLIPQSNPSYGKNIDCVKEWCIEYDDVGEYTNREIGIDNHGCLVFKAPCLNDLGYWCDNDLTMDDYKKFNIQQMKKEEFEKLWNKNT